jgi:hypothetical protein
MTAWWLIALGGVLGSSHCVGMCGGFALLLGLHRGSLWDNLKGQLVYSVGRLMSYATLGGVAGYVGQELVARVPALWNVPALLCAAAGVFLVWEGLHAMGLLRRRGAAMAAAGCLLSPLMGALLRQPGLRNTLAAGVFTGLLPCGLVYAFVSLAASSGDLLQGAAIMTVFGLGTVPLMVLTGTGAMVLTVTLRQRLWQVAAWSVVMTGVLTIGRGAAFWSTSARPLAERCPLCAARDNTPREEPFPVEVRKNTEQLLLPLVRQTGAR